MRTHRDRHWTRLVKRVDRVALYGTNVSRLGNETTICASSAFLLTRFIPKSQQDTLRTDPAYRRVRRGSLEREFSRRTRAGVLMGSDVKSGF